MQCHIYAKYKRHGQKSASFLNKGNLEITKNYRGITLTSIAVKAHNALVFNCIKPEIEKILMKNHKFPEKPIHNIIDSDTVKSSRVCAENLVATLLFVDFFKAFDSINEEKMEQILLAYGLPKETVTAIMMLYRNMKVKVCSPDGDPDFFDIVAGVLKGDTLALYLFLICLDKYFECQ